uniref:Alternative protein C1orf183 n=1 Tax=Homo sapiens TaxID=9606 RepID=L8ECI3_HUMAN|nr:alternative protein C1orf183 [Homo sapiens]
MSRNNCSQEAEQPRSNCRVEAGPWSYQHSSPTVLSAPQAGRCGSRL